MNMDWKDLIYKKENIHGAQQYFLASIAVDKYCVIIFNNIFLIL